MRRKALALSLVVVLLAALVSGCIGDGGTKTVTVTKTVGPEGTTTSPTETTQSTNSITNSPGETTSSTVRKETQTTTSNPSTTTSIVRVEDEDVISPDCKSDAWRNDYEEAIVCGVQRGFQEPIFPEDFHINTNDPYKVALEFADFLGNNVHLDVQKENQSMIKGYYYDIQTPLELGANMKGTYADFAITGAYIFLEKGLDTYIVYAETENGFGLWPAFRVNEQYYDRILIVYWPYIIPMTLGGAIELLDYAGESVKKVKIYHLWLDDKKVKAKLIETTEPGPLTPEYMMPATMDYFDNKGQVKLDLIEKLPKVIQEDNPDCKYVKSVDDIYYRNLKEYEVNVPLVLFLYSKPYHEQWMDILAKGTYEYLKQQGFDVQKCRKFTILDVTPSAFVKGGIYVRIYAEMPES